MLVGTDGEQRFPCLMMDPPWNERGGGKSVRGAQRHYPLLRTPSAIERVVRESGLWRPAANAHLYCWVTDGFLPQGLELLVRLGFRYVRTVNWHKTDRAGLGQYFRGRHELMLFAVRGDGYAVCTDRRDLPSSIACPHVYNENGQIVHSAKPAAFYELIEQRTVGPRVEFFARSRRPGWVSWGNELEAA